MLVTTVSTGSVMLWHFLVHFLNSKYIQYLLKYTLERENLLIPFQWDVQILYGLLGKLGPVVNAGVVQ